MAKVNLQMLLFVAAAASTTTYIVSSLGCEAAIVTAKPSSNGVKRATMALTGMGNANAEVHGSSNRNQHNKNMAAYGNRWTPLEQTSYRQVGASIASGSGSGSGTGTNEKSTSRRSYNNGGGHSALLNGLTILPSSQQHQHQHQHQHHHISHGYASVAPHAGAGVLRQTEAVVAKQEIPIYEEQQEDEENDYVAAIAGGYNGGHGLGRGARGSGVSAYATDNNQQQHSTLIGYRTTAYNLHAAAGAHNGGFLPSWGTALSASAPSSSSVSSKASTSSSSSSSSSSALPSTPQQHELLLQSNDKISVGNFLHHYDHNSGYGAEQQHQQQKLQQQPSLEHQLQHHQDLEEQQQPQHPYFIPATGAHYDDEISASLGNAAPTAPDYHDVEEGANYLPPATAPPAAPSPPDVINYVPYPVVKKLHVPVEKPVQIPVSQAVIVPVRKPVPIHIPIPQQVQVPVEKELKIPVERVVPFPVEKHVPVPVEKRVPYPVLKYVPVKVPRPYPVKVPVYKTVLHKMKSWW